MFFAIIFPLVLGCWVVQLALERDRSPLRWLAMMIACYFFGIVLTDLVLPLPNPEANPFAPEPVFGRIFWMRATGLGCALIPCGILFVMLPFEGSNYHLYGAVLEHGRLPKDPNRKKN